MIIIKICKQTIHEGGFVMYCRNCGAPYKAEHAVICVQCGCPKGQGNHYCPNCGNPVPENSSVCLTCGISLIPNASDFPNAKSKLAAGLLAIFLGGLGIHNFYLGFTSKAIIQLACTLVGYVLSCLVIGWFVVFGIWVWAIVEAIMIFTGQIGCDAHGVPLRD